MKRLNEFVNKINSGVYVNKDSFDAQAVEGIYYTYSKRLMLFDVDGKKGEKAKYNDLLTFLNAIRKSFAETFIRTVNGMPGMKVYLLSHAQFNTDAPRTNDWFTKFIMAYLIPTASDIEYFKSLNQDMVETLRLDSVDEGVISKLVEMGGVMQNPYDDEVILTFGLYDRGEDGRLQQPINFNDTVNEPAMKTRRVDVKRILDNAGLLHIATGEIVIESDIVE